MSLSVRIDAKSLEEAKLKALILGKDRYKCDENELKITISEKEKKVFLGLIKKSEFFAEIEKIEAFEFKEEKKEDIIVEEKKDIEESLEEEVEIKKVEIKKDNQQKRKIKKNKKNLKKKSDEVLEKEEKIIEEIKIFLNELIRSISEDVYIEFQKPDDYKLVVNLSGKNAVSLIGRHGQILDSLQYLISIIIHKNYDIDRKIILNVEDYREKRTNSLEIIAQQAAKRAIKRGHSVGLEPMNAYERQIIHSSLQNRNDVYTKSKGEEPYRRVIIYPKFKKRME